MAGQPNLESVKKEIRAVLTSTQNTLTLERLEKDYYELFGYRIPFAKLQFNSLEQFLRSSPDIGLVNGTGKFATITPFISDKSAHINEMVMRQKKPSIKSKRGRGNIPRYNTRGSYNQFRPPSVPRTRSFGYVSLAMSPGTSSNSSMMSTGSYTQPYNSPPLVTNSSIANSKIDVKPQTVITPKKSEPSKLDQPKSTHSQTFTNSRWKLDQSWTVKQENTTNPATGTYKPNIDKNIPKTSDSITSTRKKHLQLLIENQIRCGNVTKSPTNSPSKLKMDFQPVCETHTDNRTLPTENYLPVPTDVTTHSTGVYFDNALYDNGPVLDEEDQYIFTSETLEFFKPHMKAQKLSRLRSYSPEVKTDDPQTEEFVSSVPETVQKRLTVLISNYPDGIWCAELPNMYRKQFRRELRFHEYGYDSLIEMCISLKNIFHYVRPGKDDFKLYDRTKPLPKNVQANCGMVGTMDNENYNEDDVDFRVTIDDALPKRLCIEDFGYSIPKDVFLSGDIERQFLPEGTKAESVFDVVVVEAYDPSKFWVYLGTNDKSCPLDLLMNDIQSYFEKSDIRTRYAVPPRAIFEGMYLLQVWFGEYHRAKVLELFEDDESIMRVYFVDYGTVARTPRLGALFLPLEFSQLPAQAIRCRLSNVKPIYKGHPWPKEASAFFRDFVNSRDMKIKITYIDWDEEYVCVFLADMTNLNKVTYANNVMVEKNFAVWDEENQQKLYLLPNYKVKVQYLHLFPTFLELECGMAPNIADMLRMEEMNISLNFCIPQYFAWLHELKEPEETENLRQFDAFFDTVKKNRKGIVWSSPLFENQETSTEIDFSVLGSMQGEVSKFKENVDRGTTSELCIEEYYPEDHDGSCKEDIDVESNEKNYKLNDDSMEILQKVENVRKFSDSILQALGGGTNEDIFKLEYPGYSPSSEHRNSPKYKCAANYQDFPKNTGTQIFDPFEKNSHFSDSKVALHQISAFRLDKFKDDFESAFGDDQSADYDDNDINIFDNPEYFENQPEKEFDVKGISPDSFLRKVEKLARPVLTSMSDGSGSSSSQYSHYPFLSKSDASFGLKSRENQAIEKIITNFDSDSDQSLESFLTNVATLRKQARRKKKSNSSNDNYDFGDSKIDSKFYDRSSRISSSTNSQVDTYDLEETRKKFASTLSLTNPFRSFLEYDELSRVIFNQRSDLEDEEVTSFIARVSPDTTQTRKSSSTESQKEETSFEFKAPYPVRVNKEEQSTATVNIDLVTSSTTCEDTNQTSAIVSVAASIKSSVGSSRSSILSPCSTPNACSTPVFMIPPRMPTPPGGAHFSYGVSPSSSANQVYGSPMFYNSQTLPYGTSGYTYGVQNPYQQWSDGGMNQHGPQYGPQGVGNFAPPASHSRGNAQENSVRPPPGFAPRPTTSYNPNAPAFNPYQNQSQYPQQSFRPQNYPPPMGYQQFNYMNMINQQRFMAMQQMQYQPNFLNQPNFQNIMYHSGPRFYSQPQRPLTPQPVKSFTNQKASDTGSGNSTSPGVDIAPPGDDFYEKDDHMEGGSKVTEENLTSAS